MLRYETFQIWSNILFKLCISQIPLSFIYINVYILPWKICNTCYMYLFGFEFYVAIIQSLTLNNINANIRNGTHVIGVIYKIQKACNWDIMFNVLRLLLVWGHFLLVNVLFLILLLFCFCWVHRQFTILHYFFQLLIHTDAVL